MGSTPLTGALAEDYTEDHVASLEHADVMDYLRKMLH